MDRIYEVIDAKTYAALGVDYLKYDKCHPAPGSDRKADYERMRDALLKCGRPSCIAFAPGFFIGGRRIAATCGGLFYFGH